MKEQKGITLIALIITIIVMLILVGVTINVALNGGLIEKAKTAEEQTQREADKEQLLSAVIETVDNNGDLHLEQIKLPDGFEKTPEGRYKNTETGKEYTVDTKTGKVTEVTSSNSGNTENQGSSEDSGNSGNTGGTEETYSFTLNQLGKPRSITDSVVEFDAANVWTVETIGEDLSQNELYCFQGVGFIVEASDSRFQDLMEVELGKEVLDTTQYLIGMTKESTIIKIVVTDSTIGGVITSENYPTFLSNYGDVVFTFKDVSNVQIPD